jgi:DNA repair exonuclease SbcCD ATPase subunit
MTLPFRHSLIAAMAAALLTGCGAGPTGQRAADTAAVQAQLAAAAAEAARASASQPAPVNHTPPVVDDATARMLAYAERVRLMQPPELNQEIARLGDAASPSAQLQLSLVLSQLRQLPELVRAQELLARVLGNAEAQALHPLARLLASRYGEQRRLEEQLEKQNQQLRDVQRRLDQTNERLEALKAIERSLTSRQPAAPASAPAANRTRPASP